MGRYDPLIQELKEMLFDAEEEFEVLVKEVKDILETIQQNEENKASEDTCPVCGFKDNNVSKDYEYEE